MNTIIDTNIQVGLGSIATVYIPVSDFWKSKKWYENVRSYNIKSMT